jgi:DNA-binding NarL/FixJ family response regulator
MTGHLHLAAPADTAAADWSRKGAIRVVLAEDHALMRRSLRLLLDSQDGVDVVAEAGDLSTVVSCVHRNLPDVLVLDLGMPSESSIEVVRCLRADLPRTEIVVLTMEDSPWFAQQALDVGAIGFVLKDFADTELPEAVRDAARGQEYLSPRVAARMQSIRRHVSDGVLTVRETSSGP